MAWRPDEQKRLTVTAEAVTGTPARRLAMRATFMPCSASGIAQPEDHVVDLVRVETGARAEAPP